MDILDYYIKAFENVFNFDGTANRSEYWYFVFFHTLFGAILYFAILVISDLFAYLYILYVLLSLLPCFSLIIRRLHDVNKSGWWILLSFMPVTNLFFLYLLCKKSITINNRYNLTNITNINSEKYSWECKNCNNTNFNDGSNCEFCNNKKLTYNSQKNIIIKKNSDTSKTAEEWNKLGLEYGDNAETQKEIDCYKKAINLDNNYPEPYINLGWSLEEQGNIKESIQYFKKYLELSPNSEFKIELENKISEIKDTKIEQINKPNNITANKINKLQEAKNLYEKGLINEKEYSLMKSKILNI